jgi:hypothetical protein
VSTEPIVFIGPGSEWFWSMAQFVVVAVTLLGIYYQFRLQRAATAFEQLNRIAEQWGSEPMLRARLDGLRAVAGGRAIPGGAVALIGNYWEGVATLVRQGHVNARAVAESLGSETVIWWSALADTARTAREQRLDPTVFENFEWLATRLGEDAANDGAAVYDRETMARIFEASIPAMVDRIRVAEESRMTPERRAARSRRSGAAE